MSCKISNEFLFKHECKNVIASLKKKTNYTYKNNKFIKKYNKINASIVAINNIKYDFVENLRCSILLFF